MNFPFYFRPFKYAALTIGASNQVYTVTGAATAIVRLEPTVDCWIRIASDGTQPDQLGGNCLPLMAIQGAQFFQVAAGDKISVIDTDGVQTGNLSIVEMTR